MTSPEDGKTRIYFDRLRCHCHVDSQNDSDISGAGDDQYNFLGYCQRQNIIVWGCGAGYSIEPSHPDLRCSGFWLVKTPTKHIYINYQLTGAQSNTT